MSFKKLSKQARLLFVLCFIAYTAIYIGRKNFSACMSGMTSEGFLDNTLGGTVGTAFLAFYACGQFVNGLLGDKISPRIMVTVGLGGSSLANLAMGLNYVPALTPVIWAFNGYFCSMLWASIVRCISDWLPEDYHSAAGVNISVTLPLGSILSYLICAAALEWAGWRVAFICCSLILCAAAVFFFLGMSSLRTYCREMDEQNAIIRQRVAQNNAAGGKASSLSLPMLFISTGLLFAIAAILFNGILKDGLDLWVPTLINQYFGMPESFSSLLTSVLPIFNLVGVIAARAINDRLFKNEMATSALFFGISVISFAPLLLLTSIFGGNGGVPVAVTAVLLIAVTSASMLGANTLIITFMPFHFSAVGRSAAVTGILNSCSYAAASLSGVTIGFVSERFGWNAAVAAFAACALCGGLVCIAGSKAWKRGRERIS